MEVPKVERLLIRAGFALFTLALLTGFAVPAFLNHRMAVAAHRGVGDKPPNPAFGCRL